MPNQQTNPKGDNKIIIRIPLYIIIIIFILIYFLFQPSTYAIFNHNLEVSKNTSKTNNDSLENVEYDQFSTEETSPQPPKEENIETPQLESETSTSDVEQETVKQVIENKNSSNHNSTNKFYINNVPFINQLTIGYPTGCEAVSATMAAKYAGYNVSVEQIMANTPTDTQGKRQETITKEIETLNEETGEIIKTSTEETVWVAENPFKCFVGQPTLTAKQGSYGCYARSYCNCLK